MGRWNQFGSKSTVDVLFVPEFNDGSDIRYQMSDIRYQMGQMGQMVSDRFNRRLVR